MSQFGEAYDLDPTNRVIEGAIAKVGAAEASYNPAALSKHTFTFSVEVTTGEITDQKKSGRCWLFASLNSLRPAIIAKLGVKTFEFSQSYLYFFDKMEKANMFLEHVADTLDAPDDDRTLRCALANHVSDGGDWDWFCSLAEKWGVVPHEAMPDTFNATDSHAFVSRMELHLLRAAADMRAAHAAGEDERVEDIRYGVLADIYAIGRKALGTPPTHFTYDYRDKDDAFHRIEQTTPQEFLAEYVGLEELNKRIVIGYDPRPEHPFGRVLQVPFLRGMSGGRPISAFNVPIEVMKRALIAQLTDNKAVYFGCDVDRDSDRKAGILDPDLYRADETLAPLGEMEEDDRARYGARVPTHAMTFTGVNLDAEGAPITWKVENSWGDECGKKGIFSMADAWFDLHMVTCVVEKAYVDAEYAAGLDAEPIDLEPWDMLFGSV